MLINRSPAAVLALALALTSSRAGADDSSGPVHALPCRPTVACTADIVAPGVVEFEVGYAAQLKLPNWQEGTPFLIKLSVARWLQIQLGATGNVATSNASFSSFAPGLKLHLQDQHDGLPSVSVSAAVVIPTDSTSTWNVLTTLYLSRDFRWLHTDFNLGLYILDLDHAQHFQPVVALAFSTELRHHVSPMLELHFIGDAAPLSHVESGVLAGLAWAPRPWLVFDAGLDVSFVPSTRTLTLFVGATIAPARLWRPRH
jgi:hypothetical protein